MSSIPQNLSEQTKKTGVKTRENKQQPETPSEAEIAGQLVREDEQTEINRESFELQEEMHQAPRLSPGQPSTPSSVATVAPPMTEKGEFLIQLENILADGLGDIYNSLEPTARYKFKIRGEEIALKIEQMFQKSKVKIKKIISWIKNWLKLIPGVSRFFLEQSAKIKMDQILALGQGSLVKS